MANGIAADRAAVDAAFTTTWSTSPVEGHVHHASARRVRELLAGAGFGEAVQKVHRGPAPFLLTEAVARPMAAATPHSRRLARVQPVGLA